MSTRASYIRVDSKAEQLALLIGRAMDTGAIAPGEHLGTKRQLLDQYEVALGTLNEALRLLSSRGYIELRSGPRGGAFAAVRPNQVRLRHTLIEAIGDPAELSDLVKVRDELEVLVAVEAARACTSEDAERIRDAEDAVARSQPGENRLLKIWDLHREIARTGNNRILSALYTNLLDTLTSNIASVTTTRHVTQGVRDDTDVVHRNLVRAVTNNDIEGAVRAAREHTPIGPGYYSQDQ